MENIENQLKSKPIVLKYLKNRYETDEEYKKKRVEICKKYYLKKQEKENKPKRPRGRPRKIKEGDEVHNIANS